MKEQVLQDQYTEGQNFLNQRKQRQVQQLILLNNLNRGDQNIASTTLFSLVNRVHSSLYSDVLTVKFVPPEDTDYKKTEALNKLQQNDYREMDKSRIDYDWLWNTVFYGDGFCETVRWDAKRLMMVPEAVNPLMMIWDPYFGEVKDWRYYGKWITKSGVELQRLQRKGILEQDFDIKQLATGFDTDIWSYKTQHDAARQGVGVSDNTSSSFNQIYQIFEQYTYDEDGTRWCFWTDKNFSKILRRYQLDVKDDESWPIVRKQIFREPSSSISVSVPDLIEDKHRAMNVLYNLIYLAAKDEANPIYAYNPDIVKDVTQFFQRQVEQHIPMEDIEKGVKRLNLGPSLSNSIIQFISLLKTESTDAIGTTAVAPMLSRGKKSATGEALAQQVADMTASLQSKVLGNGEKEFWGQWYQSHLKHMQSSDKKVITLTNVSGVTFESITLDGIKTKYPPKIEVLSKRDADYKELVNKRDMMQVYPVVTKDMDPRALANFNKYVFLPQFIKDSSTIDRITPNSIDEIKAQQENEILEQDKLPKIDPQDDDASHIYVHYMAKKTAATWAHIFTHEEQLAYKKKQAEQQQQGGQQGQQSQQSQQSQQGQDKIKNNTRNMNQAAVPLAQETGDQLAKGGFSNAVAAK